MRSIGKDILQKITLLILVTATVQACLPSRAPDKAESLFSTISVSTYDEPGDNPVPEQIVALGQSAVPSARKHLVDTNWAKRAAAVYVLERLGAREDSAKIVEMLHDPETMVRSMSCDYIAGLHIQSATSKVMDLLSDTNPSVRVAAIHALKSLDSKEASDKIIQAMFDWEDQGTLSAGLSALEALASTKDVPRLVLLHERLTKGSEVQKDSSMQKKATELETLVARLKK